MAEIVFDGVTKRYAGGQEAVRGLDLAIADGEFLVLVGPSGCGKSTALRMVAGLEDISEGRILIGGRVANGLSPRQRNIAMVFQSYALYPHLSVAENIGFGLRVRGASKEAIAAKVRATAEMLELDALLERKPAQLSGGQRQRVAMGRAIVREPAAFLMDEPLSNLDARLRVHMRAEIARIQRLSGITTIYVTHDQVEAMTMGDRVAVLDSGVLQQVGRPRALYDEPANLFVASFIGSPAIGLFMATLAGSDGEPELVFGERRLRLPATVIARRPGLARRLGGPIVVGARPEALECVPAGASMSAAIAANVAFVEDLGSALLVHLDIDAAAPMTGKDAHIFEPAAEAAELPGRARLRLRLDGARPVRAGEPLALALDPERLHFFDRATGAAIYA